MTFLVCDEGLLLGLCSMHASLQVSVCSSYGLCHCG